MAINQRNGVHLGAHYQMKKFGKTEHLHSIKEAKLYHYLIKIKEEDGTLEADYLNWDDLIIKLKDGGQLTLQIIESPEFGNTNITMGQKIKGSSNYTKQKQQDYEFFTTDRPLVFHIKEQIDSERYVRLITLEQLDLTAVDSEGNPVNQLDVADVYFTETLQDVPDISSENAGEYLSLNRMKKFSFDNNPTEIIITGNAKQPQNVKYVVIKTEGGFPMESKKIFISDEEGSPQIKTKLWYGKKIREIGNDKYEIIEGGTKHFPQLAWPKEQDNLRDQWQLPWMDEIRYAEELFNSFINLNSQVGGTISENSIWETDKNKNNNLLQREHIGAGQPYIIPSLKNSEIINDIGNDSSNQLYVSWAAYATKAVGEGNELADENGWKKNISWMLSGNNIYSNPPQNFAGESTEQAPLNQNGYSVIYSGVTPNTNQFNLFADSSQNGKEFNNRVYKSNIGFYNWDHFINTKNQFLVIDTVWERDFVVSKPVLNDKWNFDEIGEDGSWPKDSNSQNTIGLLCEKIINGETINIGGKSYDGNIVDTDSLTLKTLSDADYNSFNWKNVDNGKNIVMTPLNIIDIYKLWNNKGEYLNKPITQFRPFYSSEVHTVVLEITVDKFEVGKIAQPVPSSIGSNYITHEALVEESSFDETWLVMELDTVEGQQIGDEGRTLRAQDIVRHLHTRHTLYYLDSELKLCKDQLGKVIEPITKNTLSKKTKNYKIVNDRTTWLGI